GGYSEYAEVRKAQQERDARSSASNSEKPAADSTTDAPPAKKKLTYAEELELGKLYPQVESWAEKVSELEAKIADPSLYTERRDEAAALNQSLQEARQMLAEVEQRWLELEERREG